MEQNIADFLKDAFPDTNFEHLHSDDDTATEVSTDVPQNEPDIKNDNNHRESSESDSDFDFNREGEIKYCSENNVNSEEQSMKTGSVLCGSWDDNNTGEKKTQSHNQRLSLQDEECRENEYDRHTDIHQQAEDISELETVLPTGASHHLETWKTSTETTSHLLSYQMLDQPENESSTSEDDRMESENTEEHLIDDNKPNRLSTSQSTSQDWPVESINIQPEGEMKEFTEEDDGDHEGEGEGLAEFTSDLSQSDSGDSSEGHEGEQTNHIDTDLVACSYKNLEEAPLSLSSREDERVDQLDMITYKDLNVETRNSEILNIGESSDFSKNFQFNCSELYRNDYDSDISSDGQDCEDQEENPDLKYNTIKNTASQGHKHTFTKDFSSDLNSLENLETCCVEDLSSIPASSGAGKNDVQREGERVDRVDVITYEDLNVETTAVKFDADMLFQMKQDICRDDTSIGDVQNTGESSNFGIFENFYSNLSSIPALSGARKRDLSETIFPENRNRSESRLSEDCSTKPEHNSERLEISDFGENINTLLPGTFWSVEVDNMKFDEYDWGINGKDEICDEDDNFLEELENDEEENERDWEKEKARIEAFNRYYEPAEGEENTGRSCKVTFSLEPESYLHYEKDSESSEEDTESNSVKQDQNYYDDDDDSPEFPHVSFTAEDISASLMGDDYLKVEEYDYDNNGEEPYNVDSRTVCKDEDDFLEKLKIEIERELEQERLEERNKYILECKEEQHEVKHRTQKALLRLHQEFSQNEDDNDSSEQESNTDDDSTKGVKTEDQSDSDECQRRLYTRHKVLKGSQRVDRQKKETPKRNKCVVLLRSVLAVSLATAFGLLSYGWATDGLDWIN